VIESKLTKIHAFNREATCYIQLDSAVLQTMFESDFVFQKHLNAKIFRKKNVYFSPDRNENPCEG
jgi:hypothetical protein